LRRVSVERQAGTPRCRCPPPGPCMMTGGTQGGEGFKDGCKEPMHARARHSTASPQGRTGRARCCGPAKKLSAIGCTGAAQRLCPASTVLGVQLPVRGAAAEMKPHAHVRRLGPKLVCGGTKSATAGCCWCRGLCKPNACTAWRPRCTGCCGRSPQHQCSSNRSRRVPHTPRPKRERDGQRGFARTPRKRAHGLAG
jgi:hypothetical protein